MVQINAATRLRAASINKGDRVSFKGTDFKGTVASGGISITLGGKPVTVYPVKWDANPKHSGIPARFKDEEGTTKSGYEAKDLHPISDASASKQLQSGIDFKTHEKCTRSLYKEIKRVFTKDGTGDPAKEDVRLVRKGKIIAIAMSSSHTAAMPGVLKKLGWRKHGKNGKATVFAREDGSWPLMISTSTSFSMPDTNILQLATVDNVSDL